MSDSFSFPMHTRPTQILKQGVNYLVRTPSRLKDELFRIEIWGLVTRDSLLLPLLLSLAVNYLKLIVFFVHFQDLEMRLLKVATCNLNQWAMDFDYNLNNIKESISKAKEAGAVIRLGPELEITGYGCEDHFLELDTVTHAIGMPVIKGSERYNCQVLCMNRKIIMIRPKMRPADGNGYMEPRWFKPWQQKDQLVDFQLPDEITAAISQKSVPFGYGYIQFLDTAIAAEVCKELFTPLPFHDDLALNGVEVFMNASGSNHQIGKALNTRLRALIGFTRGHGGVYMYSNQRGCDGGRFYYDGCSCVLVNGEVVSLGSQFSLKDVEVVLAQVDLDAVAARRGSTSVFQQENGRTRISSVAVPYKLCQPFNLQMPISSPIKINLYSSEEELSLGAACWLWDYLRRSGASGFLLPLSGGADSSSVAAIVGSMCQLVVKEISKGNEQVKADAMRIGCYTNGQYPIDSKEFAKRIFYTVFMGSENSSKIIKGRAKVLADEIGSWHLDVSIEIVVSALLSVIQTLTGKQTLNKVDGGSDVEIQGLRNIQARIRMVLALTLASVLPWVHKKSGFHLVLSSSNVDKELSGQLTKYGCSSADINPIGSINKQDIHAFLRWAATNLGYSSLAEIQAALPTLDDRGREMTSEELSVYGKWRTIFRCGPVSMFENLCHKWGSTLTPLEVANKVKKFFKYYSINRHKMTVLTPFYHAQSYSPDDNRCDIRQFLYNTRWSYQFRKIDEIVQDLQGEKVGITESSNRENIGASLG
ncbi:glutamine-dependent NAD(+) synthetase isoform X3 [Hevea brasiliensis]|uniref:glutamine-dependent NAD(+) synthetase isoform X3 n=1 Tax=Hevea brasiliensis TaxID=3981 RepID=UPI0025D2C7C1|nr:glutamine-dependent NAD(+) synthetase isoform X3 [Hevea brasiliensis]